MSLTSVLFCKVTFKMHIYKIGYVHGHKDNYRSRLARIAEALSVAPHLQLAILSISKQDLGFNQEFSHSPLLLVVKFVKKIGTNSSLQSIELLFHSKTMLDRTLDGLLGDPCMKIVQFSLRFVIAS